jgi:hypothetical protein
VDGTFGLSHTVECHAATRIDSKDEKRAGFTAIFFDSKVIARQSDTLATTRSDSLPASGGT